MRKATLKVGRLPKGGQETGRPPRPATSSHLAPMALWPHPGLAVGIPDGHGPAPLEASGLEHEGRLGAEVLEAPRAADAEGVGAPRAAEARVVLRCASRCRWRPPARIAGVGSQEPWALGQPRDRVAWVLGAAEAPPRPTDAWVTASPGGAPSAVSLVAAPRCRLPRRTGGPTVAPMIVTEIVKSRGSWRTNARSTRPYAGKGTATPGRGHHCAVDDTSGCQPHNPDRRLGRLHA